MYSIFVVRVVQVVCQPRQFQRAGAQMMSALQKTGRATVARWSGKQHEQKQRARPELCGTLDGSLGIVVSRLLPWRHDVIPNLSEITKSPTDTTKLSQSNNYITPYLLHILPTLIRQN